jgi:hypothetical protein
VPGVTRFAEEAAALRALLAQQRDGLELMRTRASEAMARLATLEELAGVAPPEPVEDPDEINAVRIGDAVYPLSGINPTPASNPAGAPYDGARGPDQLVVYARPLQVTPTNVHGIEVCVVGGEVAGARTVNWTVVPDVPGYVLSGHRKAAAWLLTHARPGAVVELVHVDQSSPAPVIDPAPGPGPAGRRTIAIYRKDGSASTARIPGGINQFRYSFFQGRGLVEWGGESVQAQAANLGRWLDGDPVRELLISAGGARGTVSTADRDRFLDDFVSAEKALGRRVGGIDWDLEAAAMVVGDVEAISKVLAGGRKSSYVISFAPPGGDPVAPALEAAVRLYRQGYRVQLGQQLYEGREPITLDAAMGALRRAVKAGLPPSCVLLGTMVGSDLKHWTIDMCVQVLRAALDEWPDLGGAYLWSEGQEAQDAEWARRMAEVLG